MQRFLALFPMMTALVLATGLLLSTAIAAQPVRVIFDTDMDSDCDDPAALGMLHALADNGEAEILATMVSSKHKWSGPCVDAINTYYGRPNVPIGVPHGPGAIEQGSKYARKIAEEFPHDLPEGDTAPDATRLYRQILASAEDHAITVITVGDLTNLRYLLESPADDLSLLDGRSLVQRKVKQWVCMGSRYPADLDPKPWGNFKPDPESTLRAITGWTTLITFTGGGPFAESLATGGKLATTTERNPVRRAYELYFDGPPKNRHSADQITVLIAIRGTGAPWKLVTEGYNHIFPNGTHEWLSSPDNPNHQYISALQNGVNPRDVARTIEDLMLQTPAHRASQ